MDKKALTQFWNKCFFYVVCPVFFLMAALSYLGEGNDYRLLIRWLGVLLLVLALVICLLPSRSRRKRLIVALWVGMMLTRISPIDISAENYPGSPHFVPYHIGTLSPDGWEAEARGDFMSGGCVQTGLQPKKVWVW